MVHIALPATGRRRADWRGTTRGEWGKEDEDHALQARSGHLMRDDVCQALAIGRNSTIEERTIDITTTGRRSGEPRRIEICFYRFENSVYLSGIPGPRTRDWLTNLTAEPHFVFHLKHAVVADLPAVATVIIDPAERRRVFVDFVDDFNHRNGPDSPWPEAVLEQWVDRSPLARISFVEVD